MLRPAVTFVAIGTEWRIETETPIGSDLMDRIATRVEAFDATYSRFRADSLVSAMRGRAGLFSFPDDARSLFELYRQLYRVTDGAVTPLVGSALEHLGYDPEYSLTRHPGPTPVVPTWDDVFESEPPGGVTGEGADGGTVLSTSRPVVLDFGAACKGYLVDLVGELLRASGIEHFLIDASGDLAHRGPDTERIGLQDPEHPDRVIGVVQLSNQALAASSVKRRAWGEDLHHVIDPATGEPARGVTATWAVADSCALADGLATALFLVSPQVLSRHYRFGYVRLHGNGRAEWSDNLDLEIFS